MKYLERVIKLPLNRSFFLFGARNTGKSTLLREIFNKEKTLLIDLLDPLEEDRYTRNPTILKAEVLATSYKYIIIDEIQKIPKLLNVVHQLIESTDKYYILTGSSSRKLKYGGANLLAGRAFVYNLFPFLSIEAGKAFELNEVLRWGALPTVLFSMKNDKEKIHFLNAYSQTYIKEEVWMEQFIRKLEPFRRFLEVSAQCNGQIINYTNISRDVGVDDKTIKQYFTILEDTLLGFFLEPFHHSFRKKLSQKPKFYFFDIGIKNALSRTLTIPIQESTSGYGQAFEHFIILEIIRLCTYFYPEYKCSYLKTKDDAEIDLVVERPGKKLLFIEIKSSKDVYKEQLTSFSKLINDYGDCEAICLSRDIRCKQLHNIIVYPWQEGINKYFVPKDD